MKNYPLTEQEIQSILNDLANHDRAQRQLIGHTVGSTISPPTMKVLPDTQLAMEFQMDQMDHDIPMSTEELAKYFNEPLPKPPAKELEIEKMSLEEIEDWENQQENSNDIYKVKARIANLARGMHASLTPQGEQLVNLYTHVLKSFYDFSDSLDDKRVKFALNELIRSQEGMPGNLISAAHAGVKEK
jgi:hypothetical protein